MACTLQLCHQIGQIPLYYFTLITSYQNFGLFCRICDSFYELVNRVVSEHSTSIDVANPQKTRFIGSLSKALLCWRRVWGIHPRFEGMKSTACKQNVVRLL